MTYSFIIPAYNEEAAIGPALAAVLAYADALGDAEALVVDDGSRDATAARVAAVAARDPRVRLIRLPENRGKGAAVQAGMAAATGEWRIFLDADLSTRPEQFETFRPHLAAADVLVGSRAVPGAAIAAHQPFWREQGGRVFNRIVRLLLGLPIQDTQCGFKCFSARAAAHFAETRTAGWAFDAEVLARAHRAGLRLKELPVAWRHDPTSHVRVSGILRALGDVLRIRRLTRTEKRPIVESPL